MTVIHVNFHARRRVGAGVRLGVFDDAGDAKTSVFAVARHDNDRVMVAVLLPEGFDSEALALEPSEARDLAEALLAVADDAES